MTSFSRSHPLWSRGVVVFIRKDVRSGKIGSISIEPFRVGLWLGHLNVNVVVATHKTIDLVVQTQVKKLQRKMRS